MRPIKDLESHYCGKLFCKSALLYTDFHPVLIVRKHPQKLPLSILLESKQDIGNVLTDYT